MENLDESPSLSVFSVCLSVLRFYEKPLLTLKTLEKFYPQEYVTKLDNDWDTMAVYNNNKQGQRKADMRALKILRATDDFMGKDSKDYF